MEWHGAFILAPMKQLLKLDWTVLMREPIMRGLLLSVCLHLAVLALLQPAPGSGKPMTIVINARLETPAPGAEAEIPSPTDATQTAPTPIEEAQQPALLASSQPSPATLHASASPATVTEAKNPAAIISANSPSPVSQPSVGTISPSAAPTSASTLPSLPLGIDTTWYLARQVDTQPRAMGRIEPAYPEEARKRNLEGTLKLMLKIDDLGRVQSAEVVEANPSGVFDEAALGAFRKARFQPAMKDGRPVRYQAYIRVDFNLED